MSILEAIDNNVQKNDDLMPWYLKEVLEEIIRVNDTALEFACEEIQCGSNQEESSTYLYNYGDDDLIFRPYNGPLHFEDDVKQVDEQVQIHVEYIGNLSALIQAYTAALMALGVAFIIHRGKRKRHSYDKAKNAESGQSDYSKDSSSLPKYPSPTLESSMSMATSTPTSTRKHSNLISKTSSPVPFLQDEDYDKPQLYLNDIQVIQHKTGLCIPSTPLPTWSRESFARQVHMIASTVSSTGLDHKESLRLANEAVIRRLEYQFERQDSKVREQYKALEMEWNDEVQRLRALVFQLFPGIVFLRCGILSLFVRLALRNRDLISKLWHGQSSFGMMLIVADHFCGCNSVQDEGLISNPLLARVSYYAPTYVTDLMASATVLTKFQMQTLPCRSLCLLQAVASLLILLIGHRTLEFFHCRQFIHNWLNLGSLMWLLPSLLIKETDIQSFAMGMHLIFLVVAHLCAMVGTYSLAKIRYNSIKDHEDHLKSSTNSIKHQRYYIQTTMVFVAVFTGVVSA